MSYGEFLNVKLSPEEHAKLQKRLGPNLELYIERLSCYLASRGKRYKSHYAVLLTWARNDRKLDLEEYELPKDESPEDKRLWDEALARYYRREGRSAAEVEGIRRGER